MNSCQLNPKLLVSVRNAHEALLASQHLVDVIDAKEPKLGSLGRPADDVLSAIASIVPSKTCMSVALGELESLQKEEFETLSLNRFTFAKIGLAKAAESRDWQQRWVEILGRLPASVNRVAVAYIDYEACGAPSIEAVIAAADRAGCAAVLMDTCQKNDGNLFSHFSPDQFRLFIQQIQASSMLAVIAGSIEIEHVDQVVALRPDLVGVRGAVCKDKRTDEICKYKLERFVKQFQDSKSNLTQTIPQTFSETD